MTKTDVKRAWTKVGDELSGLGLKLKYHMQQELTDDDDGDEVRAALKRLADAIDDTVDAAENAAKDPAVRDDVRSAGQLLIDALSTTVNEAVKSCRAAAGEATAASEPKSDAEG